MTTSRRSFLAALTRTATGLLVADDALELLAPARRYWPGWTAPALWSWPTHLQRIILPEARWKYPPHQSRFHGSQGVLIEHRVPEGDAIVGASGFGRPRIVGVMAS